MKIFNYVRVLIRAPIALVVTLLIHWFLIRIPQLFKKRRYTKPIGIWGAFLAWVMGVKLHRLNEQPEPMGDLIIANHMGFLDVPVLLACFPAVFVIKMEMRRVFYFGKALEDQGHVFVQRDKLKSRHSAREGLMHVLADGDRIIVFPEGRASPGAARRPFKPFSFAAAQRHDRLVQACVIDYMPDREMLKWDVKRPMLPQLVDLFGRRRTDISIEFFPAEKVDDPREMADRYHDMIQGKLEAYDRERGAGNGK